MFMRVQVSPATPLNNEIKLYLYVHSKCTLHSTHVHSTIRGYRGHRSFAYQV